MRMHTYSSFRCVEATYHLPQGIILQHQTVRGTQDRKFLTERKAKVIQLAVIACYVSNKKAQLLLSELLLL